MDEQIQIGIIIIMPDQQHIIIIIIILLSSSSAQSSHQPSNHAFTGSGFYLHLQGRPNKLVDGCYSFWVGGVFPLLHEIFSKDGSATASVISGIEGYLFNERTLTTKVPLCVVARPARCAGLTARCVGLTARCVGLTEC